MIDNFLTWLRRNLIFFDALYRWVFSLPVWMSWIGHFSVGLGFAWGFGLPGGTFAVGFYTAKEYKESSELTNISRDNVMDLVSPILGAAIGLYLRSL